MTLRPWTRGVVPLLALLAGALTLSGCSSSATDVVVRSTSAAAASTSSAPPTPTPTPTPEIVLWAGQVCVARDTFVSVIADLATHLEYDPDSPASAGEQFQGQLEANMGQVQKAAEDLGYAAGQVPLDYAEAGAAFVQIQDTITKLMAAKDQTMQHVTAAQEAGNIVAAGAELFQAAGAAKDTYDAGRETIDALTAATGATDGDMGEAFATAPECR